MSNKAFKHGKKPRKLKSSQSRLDVAYTDSFDQVLLEKLRDKYTRVTKKVEV